MALKLGTLTPTALYLGTTAASAAYLGATQVYSTGVADAYAIGGASPELVAAFTTQSDGTTAGEYFRKASSETTFSGLFTFARSGTATHFDSNGTLQTAADGVARRNAYRYNSASLRVRVVDPSFKGLSREERDDHVEPFLSELDDNTQADIMNLVLLYPGETRESFRAYMNNEEFEHPSQSML